MDKWKVATVGLAAVAAYLYFSKGSLQPLKDALNFFVPNTVTDHKFADSNDYGNPSDYRDAFNQDALGGIAQPCNNCPQIKVEFYGTAKAQAEFFAAHGMGA